MSGPQGDEPPPLLTPGGAGATCGPSYRGTFQLPHISGTFRGGSAKETGLDVAGQAPWQGLSTYAEAACWGLGLWM